MGEKRRYGDWDRGKYDDGGRWPSKSSRGWGQPNHARFNVWREEEGSSKPESNGWGDYHPSVPSWMRTFYTAVCRVPWRKICNAGKMMYIFKNVAEWDDSAGQEALENAKARYWAKINRLPCHLPLPDPYMYIGKVDFDVFIDPEIAADLEKCSFNPDTDDKAAINHSDTVEHDPLPTTGWGEAERSSSVDWDKYIEKPTSRWNEEVAQTDPWGSRRNQSVDVEGWDSSWKDQSRKDPETSWRPPERWKNTQDGRNSGQTDRSWKNGNPYQKQVQPQRTWHRNEFLGSNNHQRTGYSGGPWRPENAVS